MEDLEITLDLPKVKRDLLLGIHESSQRGLNHCTKWLSELVFALSYVKLPPEEAPDLRHDCGDDLEAYLVSKSYFDLKEYDRAAHFTKKCTHPKLRFLHYYSKYLSMEKKKLDNMTDANCPPDAGENAKLSELCSELKAEHFDNKLDGFCLYLYGVILKKLDLEDLALSMFVKAVNAEPMLWSAWYELGKLVQDRNKLMGLQLPGHWMKVFFVAHTHLEQLNNDEALRIYFKLREGLSTSTYLMAQIAIGHHNRRELDQAIELFQKILEIDPYRLDNLDTYSNLLYVHEMKTQLADLAHKVVLVDKYRVETCCVIGNYYSLRSDHAKAVLYFRRALKLNPQFLSAWTLMGHEYMEMKNTNAAIQSYRHAIEINNRDYRAWYGLGQTYEILKMYFYSLYYYKQAQQLKPNDSRMIIALGETYEKLEKIENALKCYYKACSIGDIEGQALLKLAKLYDKLKDQDNAAAAYTEYCLREDENKEKPADDQAETNFYNAIQYLAYYHLNKKNLDDAYTYAYKCLENEKTKEAGKTLLKDIATRRASNVVDQSLPETETIPMDMTVSVGAVSVLENEDIGASMEVTDTTPNF